MRLQGLAWEPAQAGEYRTYDGKKVYIANGTDVRYVKTLNRRSLQINKPRLLRKFEFNSQHEMVEFVRANDGHVDDGSNCRDKIHREWNDHARANGANEYEKQMYYYYGDGDSWAFGKAEASNSIEKCDKLLTDGKTTPSIRRIMNKTIKQVKLAGVDKMLNERFESVKRKRVWSEDGSELDIDRVMSGDPQHWVSTKRNGKKRVIRLGVNVSMSGGNGASTFAKNVGLAYIVCEALENLGYGVEIVAVDACYYSGGYNKLSNKQDETATIIPLKRSDEPVDINRVGSVGFSAMLRYYNFICASMIYRQAGGTCWETSDEMKAFMNVDLLVETAFSTGDEKEQATRVVRAIDKIINK
tara:strand:- start:1668 stop:2738 length:1071 start_codon:yes stop_codon:yes gene_type:complete